METIMFVKNAWYCAGWDHQLSQGKNAIIQRRIAGEELVLYRKPDGAVVAMEDRCPHRQAPLSLGMKEGDNLRCMYHGMRFSPNGQCNEIPGQTQIPERACVRVFPVVEKDNWIWVWMGDRALADPSLICFSVGPGDKEWNIKTAEVRVKANYRLEIANLMDLSHLTWVHRDTFGGTDAYTTAAVPCEMGPRGVRRDFWLRGVPAPVFLQHLMPAGMLFDLHFDVEMTVPCNFILHFSSYTQGTATEGPSNGQLLIDSYSCQAITPVDEDNVDYYYSWGASRATDSPGMSDLLHEAIKDAFLEDKEMLEGQHQRVKAKPGFVQVDIRHDAGPGRMLWLLDKMLREESAAQTASAA
jgi:vanillate O-demethylase monooxygenase subunit